MLYTEINVKSSRFLFLTSLESPLNKGGSEGVWKYRWLLFDRQMQNYALPVVNYPIFFEALGNEVYIHLLAQDKFLKYVNVIKDDVTECYSK